MPFKGVLSLNQLQDHLYSLPDQPNAIPYITSYYKERWGFCIKHNDRMKLEKGEYKVVIDSVLFDGELNYAELIIEGSSDKEIFLSSYICHPSMANNELSGPTVLTYLSKWIKEQDELKHTYRIVFIPETIGSIAYLSLNYKNMKQKIVAGFNITCVGDDRSFSFLPSRNGNTLSDKVAKHVLKWTDSNFKSYNWTDRGSDERQYCAPGIDLPIASIMRTKFGEYPEYHTSLDDLKNVVTPSGLEGGFNVFVRAINALEKNIFPKTLILCEPQLSKRGLYPDLSTKNSKKESKTLFDLISWSDGSKDLLEISEIINVPIWNLYDLVEKLKEKKLINF